MEKSVLEEKFKILNDLNTPVSDFILDLCKAYLSDCGQERKNFNSNMVKVNNNVEIPKNALVVEKYSLNKELRDNAIIFINLDNYEIGNNWFYEAQNNIWRICNVLLQTNNELLRDNKFLNDLVKNIDSRRKDNKYVVDKSKYKLYVLLRNLNKIVKENDVKNISYIIKYTENDIPKYNFVLKEFTTALKIISFKKPNLQFDYIYNYISDYMDNEFEKYNLCNFKNNQCIAQRDISDRHKFPYEDYDGCCFNVSTKKKCDYLDSCKKCKIKSISCKLLICTYLRERGVNYSIYDNLLTKVFFSLKQKLDCIWKFYIGKDELCIH